MSAPNQRTRQARDNINWIWEWANPVKFMWFSGLILPYLIGATALVMGGGLIWGFFFTPEAVNFGSSVKIIYVHVPSAFMAISAWFMMVFPALPESTVHEMLKTSVCEGSRLPMVHSPVPSL